MEQKKISAQEGKILGIFDNEDGSKSILIEMPKVSLAPLLPETFTLLEQCASAAVYNRYDPTFTPETIRGYTSGDYTKPDILKIPTDPHKRMQLANEVCIIEPICGAVVDILTSLAISGIKIDCDDKELDEYIDEFNRTVEMHQVIKWITREYYTSSNVTIYKELDKNGIPLGYTVLNPLAVKIEGSLLFNNELITIDLSEEFREFDKLDEDLKKRLLSNMPSYIRDAYRNKKETIILPSEKVTRICRNKQPYQRYAEPYLGRVFKPVLIKERLRWLDLSTVEGLVNQILLVKVGTDQFPCTDDKVLQTVAKLFTTTKPAYQVVWNHAIDAQFISRDRETLDNKKYEEPNADIAKGLGVPISLVTGEGANFSTIWTVTQSLIERVSTELSDICRWLEKEYEAVAKIKGYDSKPRVRFDKTKLRQDNYVRLVLAPLYDRGLLSAETIINEAGFNYNTELEKKKANQKESMYFLPPSLPYTGQPNNPLQHQGREPGTPSNDYKDREPQSTPDSGPNRLPEVASRIAVASVYEDDEDLIEEYYKVLYSHYQNLKEQLEGVLDIEDSVERNKQLALLYQSFLMTAFDDTFNLISKRYTDVYSKFSDDLEKDIYNKNLTSLYNWHREALSKLVLDLKYGLQNKGLEKAAVEKVFERNLFRIGLFANEGIKNASLMGLKAGFNATGVAHVRWEAVLDDKTCSICASRHGQVYNINLVPEIPVHISCRCSLVPVD